MPDDATELLRRSVAAYEELKTVLDFAIIELTNIANGFERCIIHAGSAPEMAAIRVAKARKLISEHHDRQHQWIEGE